MFNEEVMSQAWISGSRGSEEKRTTAMAHADTEDLWASGNLGVGGLGLVVVSNLVTKFQNYSTICIVASKEINIQCLFVHIKALCDGWMALISKSDATACTTVIGSRLNRSSDLYEVSRTSWNIFCGAMSANGCVIAKPASGSLIRFPSVVRSISANSFCFAIHVFRVRLKNEGKISSPETRKKRTRTKMVQQTILATLMLLSMVILCCTGAPLTSAAMLTKRDESSTLNHLSKRRVKNGQHSTENGRPATMAEMASGLCLLSEALTSPSPKVRPGPFKSCLRNVEQPNLRKS
ncbi:hypothetical protein KEM48_014469 [Puccinia striiformis f. sp. tritici PST-130]|nr:hypothetical protein KEM48_014469 [Puccinia striiformis f. sp. tritici PST-130]